MEICDKYVCAEFRTVLATLCSAVVSDFACAWRFEFRSSDWGTFERRTNAMCDRCELVCWLPVAERRDASECIVFSLIFSTPKTVADRLEYDKIGNNV